MRRLLIAAFGLTVGVSAVSTALWFLLQPPSDFREPRRFEVLPGESVRQTIHHLKEDGLIRSADLAYLLARFSGPIVLRPGIYKFDPGTSQDLLGKMARGEVDARRLTIPEGSAIRRVARMLTERQMHGDDYRQAAVLTTARQHRFPFLAALPVGRSLEGYLFPDTYDVQSDGERALVDRQLQRFAEVMMPVWQERPAYWPHTLDQTVNMASIVELEAQQPTERPTIAGVFWQRLKIRMPLGSDPTVEYALQRHQDAKGLSYRDVSVASPYNTYRYPGLPPTPIANPGLASFKATLHPDSGGYLYFVAKGDGSHVFTRTLGEHLHAGAVIQHKR